MSVDTIRRWPVLWSCVGAICSQPCDAISTRLMAVICPTGLATGQIDHIHQLVITQDHTHTHIYTRKRTQTCEEKYVSYIPMFCQQSSINRRIN